MTELNPLISRYLRQLEAELEAAGVSARESGEILNDIASHAAESEQSGRTIAVVLESLGPAADLARSYAAALFLLPAPRKGASARRQLVDAVTKAGMVCASLLLVIVMGVLGAGMTLLGAAAVLGGIVLPFASPTWLDPTIRPGLPQVVVIIAGVGLLVVGSLSLRLVRINLAIIARALRRSFQERQS